MGRKFGQYIGLLMEQEFDKHLGTVDEVTIGQHLRLLMKRRFGPAEGSDDGASVVQAFGTSSRATV